MKLNRKINDRDIQLDQRLIDVATRWTRNYVGEFDPVLEAQELLGPPPEQLSPGVARMVLNTMRCDPAASKLLEMIATETSYPAIDVLAAIQETVPESDEPRLCGCGRHYVGAPCKSRRPHLKLVEQEHKRQRQQQDPDGSPDGPGWQPRLGPGYMHKVWVRVKLKSNLIIPKGGSRLHFATNKVEGYWQMWDGEWRPHLLVRLRCGWTCGDNPFIAFDPDEAKSVCVKCFPDGIV